MKWKFLKSHKEVNNGGKEKVPGSKMIRMQERLEDLNCE